MPRKHKSSGPAAPGPLAGPQRLNKLLAAAGLGSRREVEQYILEGRIEIDGQAVTDLATKVDPETAKLTFDGSALKIFRPVYFALNKPIGVLSTNRDPSGRMRAIDLVNVKERIFSAGRLDRSSEGLMLLTNDGELAQRLSHPRYGIQKVYLATVQGEVTQADLEKLTRGVRLAEGYAKVDAVKLRKQRSGAADLEIALSEGKNREIRRILARLGHKVVALKRLAIGPLKLGQLPAGGWRPLTKHEIQALYAAALTGRRKKRGTGKPLRGKPRAGAADESGEPAMAAGQFDRYSDDGFDDNDYGPSLDEMSDEGDEEYIVVGDANPKGSVIPYDDDDDVEDDGGSMMFDDDESDEDFGDDADEEAPVRRGRPAARGPKPTGSSGRSPNDLRSRKRATGGEGSSSRTGYKAGYKSSGYKGSKGPRSTSGGSGGGASRGAKKSYTRSGSRPSDGTRQSSYSRPDTSGEGRSSTRPASRPTGSRPGGRSTGRPAGRPTTGPGNSAPRKGGPGRSGPGRSGPSSGSGGTKGGPRSGPGRSGPGRSGPPRGKGGPGKRGPGGPGRGKR